MIKRPHAHQCFTEPCEFGDPREKPEDRRKSNVAWILLTTRDRLEMTKKCLQALIDNSPKDSHLMVIDNGSVDGTVEYLCKRFAEGVIDRLFLNRHHTVQHWQKSYSVYQALGALETETYGFFAWVDNDIVVKPGWLDVARQILVKRKKTPVVNAHKSKGRGDKPGVPWKDIEKFEAELDGKKVAVDILRNRWPAGGECWIVSRKLFDKHGLPPIRTHENTGRTIVYPEDQFYTLDCVGAPFVFQIDYADNLAGNKLPRKDGWTGMGKDGRALYPEEDKK